MFVISNAKSDNIYNVQYEKKISFNSLNKLNYWCF